MYQVVLGMALKVAQLDCFRVSSHNASACQQGAVNPRFGFADVVPLPTLHAPALVAVVHAGMYALNALCTKVCPKGIIFTVSVLSHPRQCSHKEGKEGQCTHVLRNMM